MHIAAPVGHCVEEEEEEELAYMGVRKQRIRKADKEVPLCRACLKVRAVTWS